VLKTDSVTGGLVTCAAVVIIIAGIKSAETLIVPFFLALFIGLLASTPITWLTNRRVPGPVAILLVMLLILSVSVVLGMAINVSVRQFIERLPEYESRLSDLVGGALAWLKASGIAIPREFAAQILDPAAAMRFAGSAFQGVGNLLSNSFLIILLVIFIIMEAARLPDKLALAFGSNDAVQHFMRFHETLNKYMAIKSLVSLATGATVWLALTLLGVDFPLLWGILAGLLNFIPTIGSLLAAIPPVLLTLVSDGPTMAVLIMLIYFVINLVYGTILEPRIMGNELGLSTLIVFMSLIFWGWVLGPVGMLLSVPLTMTVKIAFESYESGRWLAVLLGDHREVAKRREPENGTSGKQAD